MRLVNEVTEPAEDAQARGGAGALGTLAKSQVLDVLGLSRATFYRSVSPSSASPGEDRACVATCLQEEVLSSPSKAAFSASSERSSAQRAAEPTPSGERARRTSVRSLSDEERDAVREHLYGEEFVDQTPTEIYATLLDRGVYHCSARTMYRLLKRDGPCKERTRARKRPVYAKPELLATRPNALWSWDITKLKGPERYHWFQLYVLLDVFSRYVVAWTVADREDQHIAAQLIEEALASQNVEPGTLTIHADRGAAMTSKSVALLLSDLGVTKTHSRPHVSNDNPYSEAQFKTLKYRPVFPARFGSLQDARSTCAELFGWYNGEHRHSGIALLTPAAVHYGRADAIIAQRQEVLDAAYRAHPERFVNRAPRHPDLPAAVWINPPIEPSEVRAGEHAPV